ncbi:MAG: hypothetical protein ABI704_25010 [Kofleriaceae bacterium]
MKALALAVLAACGMAPPSWAPDAGDCALYEVPSGTDLTAPAVAFKADVMPVLTAHCSSSICHGISNGAKGDLFLGGELQHGADSANVFTNLAATAEQNPKMPYVKPSDPANSYVMHKLDSDQCMFDTACTGGDCQHAMPFDGTLPVETRDIVRRWIAQGAPND